MESLDGKVALVTGATAGIGEATAKLMARRGAAVVVVGRREDRGEAVAQEIVEAGGRASFVRADVSRRDDVEAMVQHTMSAYGRLDCAVNNAGIGGPFHVPVADVEEDEWDAVMGVNLRGVWLCMKFQIPAMLAGGGGSTVNVSSIYGHKPNPMGGTPYTVSKHGLVGLTKIAAVDYAAAGLRFNAVAPGYTYSEMITDVSEDVLARHSAMDRVADADECAAAIAWLCSDAASYVTGEVLTIDGGGSARMY